MERGCTWIVISLAVAAVAGVGAGGAADAAGQGLDPLTVEAQGAWTPPACVGLFADVPCTAQFADWIEQFYRDGITSGCTAGNYCPDSPVTRRQMAVFVERAMRGTAGWPPRVVQVYSVRGVDGAPNWGASGQALLDAVAAIPTAGVDAPSAGNPWLVKLGPGWYDLPAALTLPDWVSLEGEGEQTTVLRAEGAATAIGAVNVGNGGALRSLAVANYGHAAYSWGVRVEGSDVTLEDVRIEASDGSTSVRGLWVEGNWRFTMRSSRVGVAGAGAVAVELNGADDFNLDDTSVMVYGSGTGSARGLQVMAGSRGVVRGLDVAVELSDTASSYGVAVSGSLLRISDSALQARTRGALWAIGIIAAGGSGVTADGLLITSGAEAGGTGHSAAVYVNDSAATLVDCRGAGEYGLITIGATAARVVTVGSSSLLGDELSVQNGASFATTVSNSFTSGAMTNAGTLTCRGIATAASFHTTSCPLAL